MSRIRELRKQKGLTQNKLAELIGADTNLVSRWERGKSRPISLYVQKLAQALGTSMDYLLGETNDSSSTGVIPPTVNAPVINNTGIEKLNLNNHDSSFMEKLLKDNAMIVYENNDERILLPATQDGYNFIERIRNVKNNNNNIAVAR